MSIRFEALRTRFIFKGVLRMRTALHIGSGAMGGVTDVDNHVMKDAADRPFIPGSSFKGVLRSGLESLLRAVERMPRLWSCDPLTEKPCHVERFLGTSEGARWRDEPWQKAAEELDKNESRLTGLACTVCRLFGGRGFASKVLIPDLPVDEESWKRLHLQQRSGVAIDRDTMTAADGRLYDFEVVPAGTVFDLEILVENPDLEAGGIDELGLLFSTLDLLADGHLLLGGKRAAGLGRAAVELTSANRFTPESYFMPKDRRRTAVDLAALRQECSERLSSALDASGD